MNIVKDFEFLPPFDVTKEDEELAKMVPSEIARPFVAKLLCRERQLMQLGADLARERERHDVACDRAFLAGMGLGWNLGVSEDRLEFNKRREAGYKMIREALLAPHSAQPVDTPEKENN